LALPENRDMHLVAQEHFNTSDISVAAQIARIKSADPQLLLALTTGTSLGTVFRALRDADLNVPVSTNSPNMTYAQMSAYAASLPAELYFPTLRAMTPNETLPGPLHDAQAVYLKAFHAIGVKPDGGHANAWDATMILVTALRHLGPSATAQEIRDYILHLHGWVGANGVYDFSNSTSGIGQNSAIVARWIPTKTTWIQVSRPGGGLK
jgi:branched-chain amino acid transport system substrate-binding protein